MKNYKLAILFGLFPEAIYNSIIKSSLGVIQNAADALQKCLVKGIVGNYKDSDQYYVINLPYLGSYPKLFTKIKTASCDVIFNGHKIGDNLSFINLIGYKNFSRYYQAKNALYRWCNLNKNNELVVLVYALHMPFVKACVDVKKQFKNLKIIQIVPDLPQFMGSNSESLFHKLNGGILSRLYNKIDGWVILSEYMTELLPIHSNYIVVEGIYDDTLPYNLQTENNGKFKIFYGGTLARRYGVMNLIYATLKLPKTVELNICGDGDTQEEILKIAQKDSRIKYHGQLPRAEVMKLIRMSDLLVNPRTPEGEFTKYSFPSKTMEYFASGVPTLLYRLPGIPNEYFEYCYTINELGVSPLAESIMDVMKIDSTQRNQMGMKARQFILEQKNPIVQVAKIVDFIDSI